MEAHIGLAYHLGFYFFNYFSKYKDKIHYNIKKKRQKAPTNKKNQLHNQIWRETKEQLAKMRP